MALKKDVDLKLALDTKTIAASVNRASSSFEKMSKDIKLSVFRAKKGLQGLGTSLRNIGVVAGLVAAGGIYSFNAALREVVSLANIQEGAEMRLAGVLRATGEAAGFSLPELKKYASELQDITTVGDETTLSAMAVLSTFKDIKGDQFKDATKAAIDMSVVMGTDLNSSVLQVAKSLNDPIRGMSALQRVGVSFTESQKDLIKTLQNSGNIIGAQKIILGELASEFGGVANAIKGTFKGSVDTLKNSFGDLKEEIGFTLTKNKFFLEATKILNGIVVTWTGSINTHRKSWMELSKTIGIGFITGIRLANEAVRGFYNVFKGLVLIAHGAVVAINKGLMSIVETTRKVLFKFDLLFEGLKKVGAIETNPFDAVLDSLKGFEEVSLEDFNKIWTEVEAGNAKFDQINSSIDEFKRKIENIDAVEVDPAAELTRSTERATQEITKIGDTWVNVNKKKVEASKKATDTEIDELDRFKDASGQTWREINEDAGKSIEEILKELSKVREETGKPYEMEFTKKSVSGGSSDTGYATGGKVFGESGTDKVPAMLTAGEFVIKKPAVDKFGYGIFHALNNMRMPDFPRFALGGPVLGGTGTEPVNQPSGKTVTVNFAFPGAASVPQGVFGEDSVNDLLSSFERAGLAT